MIGVPFMEIKEGQCRNPLWDEWPGSDHAMYCGKPVAEGKSYCRQCNAVLTQRVPKNLADKRMNENKPRWTVGFEAAE